MPDTDESALTSFGQLEIRDFYFSFYRNSNRDYATEATFRRGYLRRLASTCSDPDRVITEIKWCVDCSYPDRTESMLQVSGNRRVCGTCARRYRACADCSAQTRTSYLYATIDNTQVCQTCFNNNYAYCGRCDRYFNRVDARAHEHDNDENSCCKSEVQEFSIRNNGGDRLEADTRASITLPAGEISDEGIEQIRQLLSNEAYYYDDAATRRNWLLLAGKLADLGNKWQTKDGNFSKRLSRYAYKEYRLKVPPKIMTNVGNIARDHSTSVDFKIEITRKLNMSAAKFGHSESCWWSSYSNSRCTFKTNGGFGLRTFTDRGAVSGRAWVLPMKYDSMSRLTPTYDTSTAIAFIVFNGYNQLAGYAAPRILSHMMGMTYRKIGFGADPMYVNSDSGYLVGSEEVVTNFTDGSLHLSLRQHSSLYDQESRELTNA